MRICRGFLKGGEPIEVVYLEYFEDIDEIRKKIEKAKAKIVLSMKVDKPENLVFLKQVAKRHAMNKNVWIGIRTEGGFSDGKPEKLLRAYKTVREVTDTTVIVQAFKLDVPCEQLVSNHLFVNVMFSVIFEKKGDIQESIDRHLEKIKKIERECHFPVITCFFKPPLMTMQEGAKNALDEIKMLIEGLQVEDEKKKQLIRAITNMPVEPKKLIPNEEYYRGVLKSLIELNYGWYTELDEAFFEGCFEETSQIT